MKIKQQNIGIIAHNNYSFLKNIGVILTIIFIYCSPTIASEKIVDDYNYIIGTQTVGAAYKFTKKTGLVETSEAIRNMGSNLLKFSMGPRYHSELSTRYDIPYNPNIKSLADLVEEESFSTVLNMDFKYYMIWAYEFSQYTPEPKGLKKDEYQIKFIDGLDDNENATCYKEMYDFAVTLLEKYSGSGKIFYLGNWEGDWHLFWDYDKNKPANPLTIEGITRWFNTRQQAIDDAKRDTKYSDVELYHYVELNLSELAVAGNPCITNSVLPYINPDFVSLSSYSATNPPLTETEMDLTLTQHLNYIESKMQPKKGIATGKRLFIGEYGWAEDGTYFDNLSYRSPVNVDKRAKWVIKTALKWGCPFILFWEIYNNEVSPEGKQRGFWLINDKGEKLPLYYTHKNFYEEGKRWVSNFARKNNRKPSHQEFVAAALEFNALK